MDPHVAYRQTDASGRENQVHLVVLLYEQVIADLRRAVSTIASGDLVARTRELDHAIVVIGHLRANLDLERGGQVAENLDRFYGVLTNNLIKAQVASSRAILETQIELVLSLREAWLQVEQAQSGELTPRAHSRHATAVDEIHSEWSA